MIFGSPSNDKITDLLVFSHLRWNFVFQRPQHLMVRHARARRVFFFEEPIFDSATPWLERRTTDEGVKVVTPHLPTYADERKQNSQLAALVSQLVADEIKPGFTSWYYTPMALPYSRHLHPGTVVYDCMDELSAFKYAPAEIRSLEAELFHSAHVVFTGGHSLFEAKRHMHNNIYPFPSSIDVQHFESARRSPCDPPDQAEIAFPRLGFFGVIDERMDLKLIEGIAKARPDWQLVMIGPIVKIDAKQLPKCENIHYLGMKSYAELPAYLGGWNVALMPFALNESTRFISPTKTLEYLAAGRPVVSTAVRDVVRPYGELNLVRIASNADEFVRAIQIALQEEESSPRRRQKLAKFLSGTSWDITWQQMMALEKAAHTSSVRLPHLALTAGPPN